MDIKASGRSALIIAAGVSLGLWGTLQATPGVAAPQAAPSEAHAKVTPKKKKVVHHHAKPAKQHATNKPIVQAPADEDRAEATPATEPKPLADASGALPESVANANAQAAPAEASAPSDASAAPTAPAPQNAEATPAAADADIVASDQVNDLDRAAADTPIQGQPASQPSEPAATIAMAQVSSASNDDAWDKASLIGKIFIAAGGLLTLASAARMFMV